MSDFLFDTCFLIDLQREATRGGGPAHDFLTTHQEDSPWISWIVAGEFAEGFDDYDDPACSAMLARFDVLEMGEATARHYARIASHLRESGRLIGANDLWIAAAALAADLPLVTNNAGHFGRVPGLALIAYR